MTTSSAQRGTIVRYSGPIRPATVERAAVMWWIAFGFWCAGSMLGQFVHGPAAMAVPYPYARLAAGPSAAVLFGLSGVFLATLGLAMREGARWSRPLLTILGCALAVVLGWQITLSVLAGPLADDVLALPSLVALCAVPLAVGLMYSPEVNSYFDQRVDNK
jgi:hypothetical protein